MTAMPIRNGEQRHQRAFVDGARDVDRLQCVLVDQPIEMALVLLETGLALQGDDGALAVMARELVFNSSV